MQKYKNYYLTEGALSKILGGAAALGAATYFGMGDLGHPEAAEALKHGVSEFGHAMLDNIGKVGHRMYNVLPDTAKHTIDQIIHGDHPQNNSGQNLEPSLASFKKMDNDIISANNRSLYNKSDINSLLHSNDLNNQSHYSELSDTLNHLSHLAKTTGLAFGGAAAAGGAIYGASKLKDILKNRK